MTAGKACEIDELASRNHEGVDSALRHIPFNKLILSQSDVRRIVAGVSIEELAEDIARRTLLRRLTVRPVCDTDGNETGMFEIPAGGRRYRALELLVKQQRLAKTAPIPCVVREAGIIYESRFAESVHRTPYHLLEQFRAFLSLREKGQSDEEIAAGSFVAVSVVKQRLRLASVLPKLLDVYAEGGITFDQLMAFTVIGDHQRQAQVYDRLAKSQAKEPYVIRRMLTETAVQAADKRAQFIGFGAYEEAGGVILRGLFQDDDGCLLQDLSLVDRLATEKLHREAEAIRAEGWSWVEVAPDFPFGHTYGLRKLLGKQVPLTEEEQAACYALQAEQDRLEETYTHADEVPEEVDQRLAEIETALATFDDRSVAYDAEEVVRAGAFVSIDASGGLRVERGYLRPEDELLIELQIEGDQSAAPATPARAKQNPSSVSAEPDVTLEAETNEDIRPIPDWLMTELPAHPALALPHLLGGRPEVAFTAALEALCLKVFYPNAHDACLEFNLENADFAVQTPDLEDSALAKQFDDRHRAWIAALPKEPANLWEALIVLDDDSRQALFAHCVALSLNPFYELYNRRPHAHARADRIAQVLDLNHRRHRLISHRRKISRPCGQGAHLRCGAGSDGRAGYSAHRAPQEGQDGGESAGCTRRVSLAAETVAHAGPRSPRGRVSRDNRKARFRRSTGPRRKKVLYGVKKARAKMEQAAHDEPAVVGSHTLAAE